MKITATQLKKIIREEVRKATLREEVEEVKTGLSDDELETILDVAFSGLNPNDPNEQFSQKELNAARSSVGRKITTLVGDTIEALRNGTFM